MSDSPIFLTDERQRPVVMPILGHTAKTTVYSGTN